MTPYTHGGDVLTARARFGGDVLDCSANLNPLGMPPAVQAATKNKLLFDLRTKYLHVADTWEMEGRNWSPVQLSRNG